MVFMTAQNLLLLLTLLQSTLTGTQVFRGTNAMMIQTTTTSELTVEFVCRVLSFKRSTKLSTYCTKPKHHKHCMSRGEITTSNVHMLYTETSLLGAT